MGAGQQPQNTDGETKTNNVEETTSQGQLPGVLL